MLYILNSTTNPGYPLAAKRSLGGPPPKNYLAAEAVKDLLWKLIIKTLPYKKLPSIAYNNTTFRPPPHDTDNATQHI